MKQLILTCVLLSSSLGAIASQGGAEPDVSGIHAVIDVFRKAIQERDKPRFLSLFVSPTVPWQSVLSDDGLVQVREDFPRAIKARFKPENNPTAFIDDIVQAETPSEETFSNVRIDSDGDVASVAFDYRFLSGGHVKNWGKECWLMVRTETGWKITSVAYSVTLAKKDPALR